MRRLTAMLFCLAATTALWSQQDACAGYQDSPDAAHKGPRKFNVLKIAFSQADSDVLITDPQGQRFGVDPKAKGLWREIARAFYEDENTAEMDTNMPANRMPREITVHYAKGGMYLIAVTAKKDASQWLKLAASTCGKRWKRELTIPPSRKGHVSRFTLVYDSHAKEEPQLLEGDHTGDHHSP